ncbi:MULTISPECIES: helix-turn-helix transcriptional regulator [Brevibacillus]|uniref:helix-turn-helix domain-containing protein n=1 Tax=Brevibacillus TaxID=55080 RepID=UPI0030F5BCAE
MELDLEKIKRLRKEKGIPQSRMAAILGYKSRFGYQHFEKGRRNLPANKLPVLAELLETSMTDLYTPN